MQQRPRVVVSVVASADGKVALARDALLMHQPSSDLWSAMTPRAADPLTLDILEVLRQQHGCNAILEGSGSLVAENEISEDLRTYDGDPPSLYQHFLPPDITGLPSPPHMWFTVV